MPKIALIEPFFSGSHRQWAETYQQLSQQSVVIFSLPGRHWKWRMHGGALSLARQFLASDQTFDLLLVSDMLDLTTFLALTRHKSHAIPVALYFHENQLTYPWSPDDKDPSKGQDLHYAFINYSSALAADRVFFNSQYHFDSFLGSLPPFLKRYPDFKELSTVEEIRRKSQVLPLGMSLERFLPYRQVKRSGPPVVLWNHRWEYDKAPEAFFEALFRLAEEKLDFRLIVLGESFKSSPPIFEEARQRLSEQILHFGYAEDFASYARYLWQSDIVYVSSRQDFFGGSVVEAIYCQCHPILPNRLAYVEHLPAGERQRYLYDQPKEGIEKLRRAFQGIDHIRQARHYQNFVARYDWSNLAQDYDAIFAKIIHQTA
ncbi:MAG: DUF3524 domain-containing protein [Bacteroidota bacterium]